MLMLMLMILITRLIPNILFFKQKCKISLISGENNWILCAKHLRLRLRWLNYYDTYTQQSNYQYYI